MDISYLSCILAVHIRFIDWFIIGSGDTEMNNEYSLLFKVEAIVWDMKQGCVMSLKYNDNIYKLDNDNQKITTPMEQKVIPSVFVVRKHKRYFNVVDRWIKRDHVTGFSFDMFSKSNPLVRRNRFNHFVSLMIQDHSLVQVGKDNFKVIKKEG